MAELVEAINRLGDITAAGTILIFVGIALMILFYRNKGGRED